MKKNRVNQNYLKEKKVYRKRKYWQLYRKGKNRYNNRPKPAKVKKRSYSAHFRKKPAVLLTVPEYFSFINYPDKAAAFFRQFGLYAVERRDIVLDFRQVKQITPDVIPLLLAKVSKYQHLIQFFGNRPNDVQLNTLLQESGFYKIVGISNKPPTLGLLDTHKSKIVDTEVAVAARKFTAEKTFNNSEKKIFALYRTLIECMGNTKKHASEKTSVGETWWLSVYNDPVTKITSFSFCDTGVGIFKSARIQNITKFAMALGITKNSDILQRILEGRVQSSTGLHYRGKVLPKIYSDYKNNQLKRLVIAANDVFADFDNGPFIELKNPLNGTFLYWEITPN